MIGHGQGNRTQVPGCGSRWRDLVEAEIRIRQFYLAAAPDRTIRIRISDGASAMLTLKFSGEDVARDEFEYPVPLAEAEEMQAFAIGRVIEKTRYHVHHGGYLYEVDVFGGELAGLVIAELETPDDVPEEKLPPWLGREVTRRRAILQRIACPPRGSGVRRMSYRIDPRPPLTAEVQRIAAEEIDKALRHLAAARDNPDKALHECRKRLKSLRALLRLVRSGDEAFAQAENARYREVSARLAGPREAAALIETVDRLAEAFPDETADGALDPVRDRLVARRGDVLMTAKISRRSSARRSPPARPACAGSGSWRCPTSRKGRPTFSPKAPARPCAGRAKPCRRRRTRGEPEDFHDLRKAVKAHAMHLSLLKKLWPSPVKARRKAVDALGEKLGDLHDIFVLRALLRTRRSHSAAAPKRGCLTGSPSAPNESCARTCLAEASELFSDNPKRSAKKLARKVAA